MRWDIEVETEIETVRKQDVVGYDGKNSTMRQISWGPGV